ncbi:AAA family ATPase [Cohnella abietis]|uniref:YhaN AAA domain-containing protein n=1 Tax=Cohnella abietis TaxID=2507935 RepID=A0A3T1D3E5_9BACL|nr:AAA family ATPase [Cohnella abietis]BBI32627.1 hypothetical protein KCTCHS21_20260 [Cohnella abietis]
MYIRELHVDGYGALQGLKLEFKAPITVIYGPNEAGKSTLLRFVRSMLYGFPTRKDPVERGEPVFGGRHGGRLLLSDKSGRKWILERYAERGNDILLREESGIERILGQTEWERLLLGGISERLFRQLFAVSLNELHELRSLQGEEIGNYLYHAGLAGGSALTAARRQIGTEMDRLFRPKGTTQEMNRLLAAMKETETAIRQSGDGVQYYYETGEALAEVEQQLALLDQQFPELRMQTAKLQGAYELREWWLKREALLTEETEIRNQLPDPSAPLLREATIVAWPDLKLRRQEAIIKLNRATSTQLELQIQREKMTWDEEWVSSVAELERLESLREGMIAKREERTELEAERRMLDESLQSTLSRLSANWGEEELLSFGGLVAERERVRRLQISWEETERALATLDSEIRRIARQREVLQSEESSLSAAESLADKDAGLSLKGQSQTFGLFIPRTKPALIQAWHNVEDARREYERARSITRPSRSNGSRTSQRMAVPPRMQYGIAGLLGAAAITLPLLMNSEDKAAPVVYLISAILLIISAGTLITALRRKSESRNRTATDASSPTSDHDIASIRLHHKLVNDRLRQLMNDPETAVAKLIPDLQEMASADLPQQSEAEDLMWQQLRGAVYEQLERFEVMEREKSKQQELQGRGQELQRERELVERDSVKLHQRLDELQEQWMEWLHNRRLPSHLTPDVLPELLGLAEQGQTLLRQRQRVMERMNTLATALAEFEQAASRLIEACPPPAHIRMDILQAIQWLYRESLKQLEVKEAAERADQQLMAASAFVNEVHEELKEIEDSVAALFTEAQAVNEAELEERLRIDGRCQALRKEAREIQLRLESGRDAVAQAKLYELLDSYDEAALASLLQEQKGLLEAEEARRTDLLDRRGRLAQELNRQRNEAELEDKGQRLRELQSKLEQLTERYAILALCDRLIVQTKAVYEEERQPEVLQHASRYLKQMTNGTYTRIVAPGDTKALLAETHDQRQLDSLYLSRGTQEQLYLAMRFALCNAASPEHPLPLLLDDLFVHFDEQRLIQSLPVLQDLSGQRQVFLFTCHRHVAQTIASGIPTAQLLTLGD